MTEEDPRPELSWAFFGGTKLFSSSLAREGRSDVVVQRVGFSLKSGEVVALPICLFKECLGGIA